VPVIRPHPLFFRRPLLPLLLALLASPGPAASAPFTPTSDQQVLERLPTRAADPRLREMAALRQRLQADPRDLDTAVALARRYFEEVAAEGDPRYIGYAQAALAPWWSQPAPPPAVRLLRGMLLQFGHEFDPAVTDFTAAAQAPETAAEGWSWLAAVAMVQARYADAAAACRALAPMATPLTAVACQAQVDAATGRGAAAAAALQAALQTPGEASAAEQLWALTRLAETEERLGRLPEAEAAFRRALALNLTDGYLLAAYADFLLDRGRAAEVLPLLRGRERSDLLLLRLALAAKATNAPELARWQADLGARFDAARRRGDSVHEKEEARFALAVLGDVPRALALARSNFAVQREPADARVLLEAALAARDPAAAAPALQWLAESNIESVVLRPLAQRLQAGGR
jgi:hypothetical protein